MCPHRACENSKARRGRGHDGHLMPADAGCHPADESLQSAPPTPRRRPDRTFHCAFVFRNDFILLPVNVIPGHLKRFGFYPHSAARLHGRIGRKCFRKQLHRLAEFWRRNPLAFFLVLLEKIRQPQFGGCPNPRLQALANQLAANLDSAIVIPVNWRIAADSAPWETSAICRCSKDARPVCGG